MTIPKVCSQSYWANNAPHSDEVIRARVAWVEALGVRAYVRPCFSYRSEILDHLEMYRTTTGAVVISSPYNPDDATAAKLCMQRLEDPLYEGAVTYQKTFESKAHAVAWLKSADSLVSRCADPNVRFAGIS